MTKQELKSKLTPLVLQKANGEDVGHQLALIAREWLDSFPPETEIDNVFDDWNTVMAEIVEDYNLAKH